MFWGALKGNDLFSLAFYINFRYQNCHIKVSRKFKILNFPDCYCTLDPTCITLSPPIIPLFLTIRLICVHLNLRYQGMFQKVKEMAGSLQNRLSALILHNNFDINFNVERVKNVFGRRHRIFGFAIIWASILEMLIFSK